MVTKALGRFINRPTRTGRGLYDKFFVYVPTEVARDSSFPFQPGEEVHVEIDSEKRGLLILSIEKKTTRAKNRQLVAR